MLKLGQIIWQDLLHDRTGFGKKPLECSATIYRRNLQRAYIERMEYLMTEETKQKRTIL
jgi:hypothetical protein